MHDGTPIALVAPALDCALGDALSYSVTYFTSVHTAVFWLLRWLKAQPQYRGLPVGSQRLRAVALQWHEAAGQAGLIDEKVTIDDVCGRFVQGWPTIRFALGEGPAEVAARAAATEPLPAQARRYDSSAAQKLVALCWQLQRQAGVGEAFFLSCRVAASVVGTTGPGASRLLALLVADGVLERVTPPDLRRRRATRFRWCAK